MPMRTNARRWTRDEVLLAMNLYCRIPFGRQHKSAPEVIELAAALDRTTSSVAMKLNNLTSLDPEEHARGVRGLPGASELDQQVWNEFHANWDALAAESEALWDRMVIRRSESGPVVVEPQSQSHEIDEPPVRAGPTEAERMTRVRLSQSFFRRVVLSAYGGACCITGIPIPGLLDAAHIVSWSRMPEHRANPRNGLCVSRLHHAALDQGLITIDDEHRLVLGALLRESLSNEALRASFQSYEGHPIRLPERFAPTPAFWAMHRELVFRG